MVYLVNQFKAMNEFRKTELAHIVTEDSNVIVREGYYDMLNQVVFITTDGEVFPWSQVHRSHDKALASALNLRVKLKTIVHGPPKHLRSFSESKA